MLGLLLKDAYVLRRTAKVYLAMLAFYLVLTVAGAFDSTMVTGFLCLFSMMLPVSSFSYDELARWDRYAAALPAGRRGVVQAKYLLVLCTGALALALTAVLAVLLLLLKGIAPGQTLLTGLLCVSIGLVMNGILLPLLFRFGAEKGRILMLAVGAAMFLLVLGGARLLGADGGFAVPFPEELIGACAAAFTALALFISYRISLNIFENKEL